MSAPIELVPVPPLFDQLCGRWSISLKGYFIVAVSIVLSIYFLEEASVLSVADAIVWAGISVFVCVGYGLYLMFLVRFTPFRERSSRNVPRSVLVISFAIGGFIISGLKRVGASIAHKTILMPQDREFVLLVVAAWFGLSVIVYLDQSDRSRRNRQISLDRQMSMELLSIQQSELLNHLRREAISDVTEELRSVSRDLSQRIEHLSSVSDDSRLGDLSGMLKTLSNTSVRSISSQLWSVEPMPYPPVKWHENVVTVLRTEEFRPFWLAFIHLVGSGPTMLRQFGTTTTLGMLAVTIFYVVVVTCCGNAMMRHYQELHLRFFMITMCVLQMYVVPLAVWRNRVIVGSGSVAWCVAQVVAGTMVVGMTSGAGSWFRMRSMLDETYLETLNTEMVASVARSRLVAGLARELSNELHGSVQTKLTVYAAVCERAVQTGDFDELTKTLLGAQAVLDSPFSVMVDNRGISSEVNHKVSLWTGLCGFTVSIEPNIESRDQNYSSEGLIVGKIVEEAISNAMRHGNATEIAISISSDNDGSVRIVVTDNGGGLSGGTPSIGSAYIDQVTGGNWSLTSLANGVRLDAVLPVMSA